MTKKNLKAFMVTLSLIGIVLSVLNFVPKLYAPSLWGTVTELTPENIWDYYQEYGIEGLNDRHIEGDFYCVDAACDCVMVI